MRDRLLGEGERYPQLLSRILKCDRDLATYKRADDPCCDLKKKKKEEIP